MYTNTGRLSAAAFAGVQTLTKRQSSLIAPWVMTSYVHVLLSCTMRWMQLGPNSAAWRTPVHATGGSGAFHRLSPTGGAANGMPLNAVRPGFRPAAPETVPPSPLTGPIG